MSNIVAIKGEIYTRKMCGSFILVLKMVSLGVIVTSVNSYERVLG